MAADATLTKTELRELGFIRNEKRKVKLLAKGELTKKLKITVDVASAQAVALVQQAGGEVVTTK